jgi:hypothetical protein
MIRSIHSIASMLSIFVASSLTACSGELEALQDPPPLAGDGSAIVQGKRTNARFVLLGDDFSPYCTAVLLVDEPIASATGAGGWKDDGTLQAPAGTTVLLTSGFDSLGGVAIQANGVPAELDTSGRTFEAGIDFTSRCAPSTPAPNATRITLLRRSTFYASRDFSGPGCSLPAGTGLDECQYWTDGPTSPFEATSVEIQKQCRMQRAYSNDITFAALLPY